MNTTFEQIIKLSTINPEIQYDFRPLSYNATYSTKKLIEIYFERQPKSYFSEIEKFAQLNNVSVKGKKAFVFIPCYNENKNLINLINLYTQQDFQEKFEICFVLNFAKRDNNYSDDLDNFYNAIKILLEKKNEFADLHIVAKQFENNSFGLGRARKYGMDYCLYRIMHLSDKEVDKSFIVSNEGDMINISTYYLTHYQDIFKINPLKLVQGRIDYPEFIKSSYWLNLYTQTKEIVHLGQGINPEDFKYFGGIMPIGRNFAVHPRICALIGGIDPTFRVGTDDDIRFGNDIRLLLGNDYKTVESVKVITNPRREVLLVNDILKGLNNDGKKMYQDFHNVTFIYDLSLDTIINIATQLEKIEPSQTLLCKLTNEFFQWTHLTNSKNYFYQNPYFTIIQGDYDIHNTGYWESQNKFRELFEKLSNKKMNSTINDSSLILFNNLIKPLNISFSQLTEGVNPNLIE